MQEDNLIANENAGGRPRAAGVARHRLPSRTAGRSRYLVAGAAILVGLGVVGVAVATSGNRSGPAPATVAVGDQGRTEAATRADRSVRDSVAPVTPTAPTATTATPVVPAPTSARPSASPSARRAVSPPAKPSASVKPAPRPSTTTAAPKTGWVNPLPGAEVTSCYGMRWGVLHAGIDLAGPDGTPIHAAAAGTVVNAGWDFSGYGISVVIDHGNGYLTHYAHQSRTAVTVGQKVAAGDIIGYEGATGDATGPHLHFEVHQGQLWSQIDPAPFMRARGVDLGC